MRFFSCLALVGVLLYYYSAKDFRSTFNNFWVFEISRSKFKLSRVFNHGDYVRRIHFSISSVVIWVWHVGSNFAIGHSQSMRYGSKSLISIDYICLSVSWFSCSFSLLSLLPWIGFELMERIMKSAWCQWACLMGFTLEKRDLVHNLPPSRWRIFLTPTPRL